MKITQISRCSVLKICLTMLGDFLILLIGKKTHNNSALIIRNFVNQITHVVIEQQTKWRDKSKMQRNSITPMILWIVTPIQGILYKLYQHHRIFLWLLFCFCLGAFYCWLPANELSGYKSPRLSAGHKRGPIITRDLDTPMQWGCSVRRLADRSI